MDFYLQNGPSSDYPTEQLLSPVCPKHENYSSSLEDLFPSHNTEGDVSLEWLSIFVEDCLTSTGNCIPQPTNLQDNNNNPIVSQPPKPIEEKPNQSQLSTHDFSVPSKARSKRKRSTTTTSTPLFNSFHVTSSSYSDPPLLHQAYWLADSELIVPKKNLGEETRDDKIECKDSSGSLEASNVGQPRRCTHCLSQRTPQWRAGPLGPKTLCNACGVRFKSGRLLPEYRPAKSPTFVSYKHSNSHKKVLEMRTSILSSIPTD